MYREPYLGLQLFGLTVLIVGGGILMASLTRPDDVKYVLDKENHCQLKEKHETDKRLYCGKACTTPEIRHIFKCPKRGEVIVDWYDIRM